MNELDIPRHKKWTPKQPSSVPLQPWTESEPHKDFWNKKEKDEIEEDMQVLPENKSCLIG